MEPTQPGGSFLTIPIAIIVAGVLIAGAVIFIGRGEAVPTPDSGGNNNQPTTAGEVKIRPVSSQDHILGKPSAAVVLIEFSDLECPFCKRFQATVYQLMDKYGKGGDLAWVYRQFPIVSLHSKAPAESHASECVAELAGNDAFWTYIDKIFEATPSNNGLDLNLLSQFAVELGVSKADFDACQESGRHQDRIEADLEDGVNAGLRGTPYSIFLTKNGKTFVVEGAVSFESLEATFKEALAASKK